MLFANIVKTLFITVLFASCSTHRNLDNKQSEPVKLAWQTERPFTVDVTIFDSKSMPFIPHDGAGKYQSYLVLNLPYAPINRLLKEVETTCGLTLMSRGEAHITVVTPPEYEILKRNIGIDKINELVADAIQSVPFEIICLGRGAAHVDNKLESTYFLVVKSRGLEDIRQLIRGQFAKAGGDPSAFTQDYFPHITVGFTQHDLHGVDGVIKDDASCTAPIIKAVDNRP